MTCDKYDLEKISAYQDGQLDDKERASFEEHVKQCSECAELLELMSRTADAILDHYIRKSCYSIETLIAYAHDQLPDELESMIYDHVEKCIHCRDTLEAIGAYYSMPGVAFSEAGTEPTEIAEPVYLKPKAIDSKTPKTSISEKLKLVFLCKQPVTLGSRKGGYYKVQSPWYAFLVPSRTRQGVIYLPVAPLILALLFCSIFVPAYTFNGSIIIDKPLGQVGIATLKLEEKPLSLRDQWNMMFCLEYDDNIWIQDFREYKSSETEYIFRFRIGTPGIPYKTFLILVHDRKELIEEKLTKLYYRSDFENDFGWDANRIQWVNEEITWEQSKTTSEAAFTLNSLRLSPNALFLSQRMRGPGILVGVYILLYAFIWFLYKRREQKCIDTRSF